MTAVFLHVLNMSISAGWIVLVLLVMRPLLKKAPCRMSVWLWGLVAVRLICPIFFQSRISLIPSAQTFSPDIEMQHVPNIQSGIPIVNETVNPIIGEVFAPALGDSVNPLQVILLLAAVLWCTGTVVMLAYIVISYLQLYRRTRTAVPLCDNIYQSRAIASPFVLGIIKPRIYLPFGLDGQTAAYVVAHEQAHIQRKDHWWKLLGFVLMAVHWFNPLMWLGYALLCRDIELACDEKVVRRLDRGQKADYSQALLCCSVNRRSIAAYHPAFGEVGVKGRIKRVLKHKQPAIGTVIVTAVLSVAMAAGFLTDPLLTEGVSEEYRQAQAVYEKFLIEQASSSIDKYILYDLNDDEVPELICFERSVPSIFTYRNGTIKQLKVPYANHINGATKILKNGALLFKCYRSGPGIAYTYHYAVLENDIVTDKRTFEYTHINCFTSYRFGEQEVTEQTWLSLTDKYLNAPEAAISWHSYLQLMYDAARSAFERQPSVHRDIGALQAKTRHILVADGRYYQSYVALDTETRYVWVRSSEGQWHWQAIGSAQEYSVDAV